jgi:metal-dependent amidase/aminoacylase/carboxypeptidase family protein
MGRPEDLIGKVIVDAQRYYDYARRLRRDFHRFPELGFQENRTSQIVAMSWDHSGW